MVENNYMSSDDLEEQGLVECCSHCYSFGIIEEPNGTKICKDCLTVGFTEIITEMEWIEKTKINC